MRVAYITSQAVSAAGWGRYSVEVIKGARALGIEPVLVTPPTDVDEALQDLEHHAILPPVFAHKFSTPRSLTHAPKLNEVLKTCDAVHCIVELYAPLVARALPKDMLFVLSVFGTWAIRPLENRWQRMFFEPAFSRANIILSISTFTRDWMGRLMTLPRNEVLAGGVHPERFQGEVAAEAELPDFVGRDPVVLSVGAVKPRKGQNVAIEAVGLLKDRFSNLHYAMAGSFVEVPEFSTQLRL